MSTDDPDPGHQHGMCVICMHDIGPRDSIVRLSCMHTLHSRCMMNYALKRAPGHTEIACPVCRNPVPEYQDVHQTSVEAATMRSFLSNLLITATPVQMVPVVPPNSSEVRR
jgi:hypothetical protein